MSTTILNIIPADPDFIPDKSLQDKATAILGKLYKEGQFELVNYDTIVFVDQGQNFDSVSCNLCNKEIGIEIWQGAMEAADEQQFSDLTFITPCCQGKSSLNDLSYHTAAGFARFCIKISDPQVEIPEAQFKDLQVLLGTPLRIVWAHY